MLEKESEMLEAKEEKEMELEMKHCQPEKEEGEDVVLHCEWSHLFYGHCVFFSFNNPNKVLCR